MKEARFPWARWRARLRTALSIALIVLLFHAGGSLAEDADEQYAFAVGLYQQELYEEAAEQFGKFLTENPKHAKVPHALFAMGQCQQLLKQYDKAAATFEKLTTAFPAFESAANARLQQGICYLELKQADKARAALQHAAKAMDEKIKAQAFYWIAESFYAEDDFANSLKYYQQVTAFPQSDVAPYAYYSIGLCQNQQGNPAAASQAFQKVFTSYPQAEVAPECRYRYAESLYKQKKYAEAQKEYQAFTAQYADSPFAASAWVGLGYCAFEQKDYSTAIGFFEKAVSTLTSGSALRAEAMMRLGDCHYQLKQWDRALNAYGKILQEPKNPLREQALYWTGNARREQGDLDGALAAYRDLLRAFPQSPLLARAYLRMADICLDQKKYVEAIENYKKVQSLKPAEDIAKEAEAGLNEVIALQVSAGSAEAEKVAEQLKGEAAARAWVQIADGTFRQKNYTKAVQCYDKALANAVKGSQWEERALYGLAASQFQMRNFAQAIANFRKQLASFPKGKLADIARVDLAWTLIANKQAGEVDGVMQPFLDNRPADRVLLASGLQAAAEAAVAMNKWDRAVSLYEELSTKFTDNPETTIAALLGLGSALMEQNKYARAAATFRQVIDRKPSADLAALAYLRLGVALSKQDLKSDALTTLQKVCREYPDSGLADLALYEMGWIHIEQKNAEETIRTFTELITRYPQSTHVAEALFHIGECWFERKGFASAADYYRQLTTKHTQSEFMDRALYKLGAALYHQKDFTGAIQAFQQVLAKYPQSAFASESQFWLADSWERLGRLDEAKAAYTTFTQKYPSDALASRACLGLARVFVAQKNWTTAKDTLQKIDPKSDSVTLAEVVKLSGDIAFAQKAFKEALENYLKVCIIYPTSPFVAESLFQVGQCQEQLGNKDKAKEAYQRIMNEYADTPFAEKAKVRLQGM